MKMINKRGVVADMHPSAIERKLRSGWKIFEQAVEIKAEPMPLTKPTIKGDK
jgi:hypothetical protein